MADFVITNNQHYKNIADAIREKSGTDVKYKPAEMAPAILGIQSGVGEEIDPVFSASAAAGITSTDISNWNGKSNFSGSYEDLTNKPTIPAEYNDTALVNRVSTLEKAEYQTASQVNSAITSAVENINSFDVSIVNTLPAVASANTHTIYFVPNEENSYNEYMVINNTWELIGNTSVNLDGYAQTADLATVATSGSYNDLLDKPEALSITNTLASGELIATINGTNIYAPSYEDGDNLEYGG